MDKDQGIISVRTFDSLGCTVAATAVLRSLRKAVPRKRIIVYTKSPDFFIGLPEIAVRAPKKELKHYDVDLRGYLASRPHNSQPYRQLYNHMIEIAEKALSLKLPSMPPKVVLSKEELSWARQMAKGFGKPLVWIQSKTNSENKDWPIENWRRLIELLRAKYQVIDLSERQFTLRQALALSTVGVGGITGDTFMMHGSAAVDAKNVLVLLGSSRPEATAYPSQQYIYSEVSCKVQPCGMHGYAVGCGQEGERLFKGHERSLCITDDYRCMAGISLDEVTEKFKEMLQKAQRSR
jgi:ADP-heptose:LPS heptosyltransferase